MFPRQIEIELPLLQVLVDLGGEAKPRDVYPLVAQRFPQLTSEEVEQRLENYPSIRKWSNLVQWVRQRLVDAGQIDGSRRGVWRITSLGRERLTAGATLVSTPVQQASTVITAPLSLRDLVNANLQEIRSRLVAELKDLTAFTFEHFCREFLAHLGYRSVEVTKKGADGGIDGHGDFRQGAISIRSAFQAKRWTEKAVGRPEIDKFRGANSKRLRPRRFPDDEQIFLRGEAGVVQERCDYDSLVGRRCDRRHTRRTRGSAYDVSLCTSTTSTKSLQHQRGLRQRSKRAQSPP
ncbi:MAG: winged helix-turn-helix domain-containing protein [Thermoanaerobaculia bacterium]